MYREKNERLDIVYNLTELIVVRKSPREAVSPVCFEPVIYRWACLAYLQASRCESGLLTSTLESSPFFQSIGSITLRAITNTPG